MSKNIDSIDEGESDTHEQDRNSYYLNNVTHSVFYVININIKQYNFILGFRVQFYIRVIYRT